MRARLFAKTGQFAGKSFELGAEATIGRAASNSIVLADPLISSRHSRIFFDEAASCYRLEDLQSRNHTFLAGVRVHGPERLDRLEVITFGGAFDFIFQVLDGEAAAGARPREDAAVGTRIDLDGAAPLPAALGGDARPPTLLDLEGVASLPAALGGAVPAGTLYDVEGVGLPPGLGTAAPARQDLLGREALPSGTLYDAEGVGLPPGLGDPPPPPAVIAPPPPPAVTAAPPPPAATAPPPAAVTAAPGMEAWPQPRFRLRVELQDGSLELVELETGDNWVGRAPTCTVSIDDPTLSRRHARLVVGDDGVRVIDPGSTNHTYVGDAEVPVNVEVEVALGVPLLFGSVKAVLALAEPEPGQPPERSR
jgi:pSer/pThr/pTyr-binding forkhead associated (FHA) protein